MKRALLHFVLLFLAAWQASCGSTLTSYPRQSQKVYDLYASGRIDQAATEIAGKSYDGKRDSIDGVLWLLEEGKILHAAGRFEESNAVFAKAEAKINEYKAKAVISASDAGAEVASAATNANAIPYAGRWQDRILLHTYKALNYMGLCDWEGAAVEARLAYESQREARDAYASDIEDAAKTAETVEDKQADAAVSDPENQQKLAAEYADVKSYLTPEYANFSNPYTSYVSAIARSIDGEPGEALVDLRDVAAMVPGATMVGEHAKALDAKPAQTVANTLHVFFESGPGPRMVETKLAIFVPNIGLVALALPKVQPQLVEPSRIMVRAKDGRVLATSETLACADNLAMAEFDANLGTTMLRTITATVAKAILTYQLQKEHGTAGLILGSLYSAIMSNADLRSWRTVGKEFQVVCADLSQGRDVELCLTDGRSNVIAVRDLALPATGPAVVIATSVMPGHLEAHVAAKPKPAPAAQAETKAAP